MNKSRVTAKQLRQALRKREIVPWYQPVVDAQGRVTGVEVLARWLRKDALRVSPDTFIPLAMEAGLIVPLTSQLMRQTARELSSRVRWLPQPFSVGFNMPAVCLKDSALPLHCQRFLSVFPPFVKLVLEVSERDAAPDLYQAADTLTALIFDGIEVALDDFGTGGANLNLLCRLPLTTIKLDRMFCTGEPGSAESMTAAAAMRLARSLGMRVLAEGVESLAQVRRMRALGASAFQGFYFSPPVSIHRLIWRVLPGALGLGGERSRPISHR